MSIIEFFCMCKEEKSYGRYSFFVLRFAFSAMQYWMQTEEQKTGEAWERGYGRQSNNVTQVVVCSLIPRLQANEAKLIHTKWFV